MYTHRLQLISRYLRAPWSAKSAEATGDLQATFGAVGAASAALNVLITMITSALSAAVLIAATLVTSPVAAACVIGVIVLLFFVLRPIANRGALHAKAVHRSNARSVGDVLESVSLGREAEVFGVADPIIARADRAITSARQSEFAVNALARTSAAIYPNAITTIALVGVWAAAGLGATDPASLGLVVILLLRVAGYAQGLQSSYHQAQDRAPFVVAVSELAERLGNATIPDGTQPITKIDSLQIADAAFAYDPATPVLTGVSLTIGSGEVVGLVGPSGSGKSTLSQLALGLRDPSSGSVRINGQPLREFRRAQLTRLLAFVPQEPVLLDDTIAANIRFERAWITDADIDRAIRDTALETLIAERPGGLEATVGERGGLLSAGQRQRVCIARALAGSPGFLVLDEPTSALDPVSESAIQATVEALRGRCAVMVIAHRLNTLDACDRVVVLVDGEVRGVGTPAQLRETNTYYREAVTQLSATTPVRQSESC
jgi:ABC-type multidrug transport system fused ATPase/permease subunit